MTKDDVIVCLRHALREVERDSLGHKVATDAWHQALYDACKKGYEIGREYERDKQTRVA